MTIIDEDSDVREDVREVAARANETRLVWDLPVRLVHWSLVVSFIGAYVTNRLGVAWFDWHVRFGYAILGLVAFRILWGVLGPKHARFASFVTGPAGILRYMRRSMRGDAPPYAGHNPLGALMVVALLLGLGAQASLGLVSNDEIFNAGPFVGLVTKEASLASTAWHKRGFYILAAAVAVHIVAVAAHVLFKRDNLVRAMITGRKPAHIVRPDDEIVDSRLLLAGALLLCVAAALAASTYLASIGEASVDPF
jgi:cytochrome b